MRPRSPEVYHVTVTKAHFQFQFVLGKHIRRHFIRLVYLYVLDVEVLRVKKKPTPTLTRHLPALVFKHHVTKCLKSGRKPGGNKRWRHGDICMGLLKVTN